MAINGYPEHERGLVDVARLEGPLWSTGFEDVLCEQLVGADAFVIVALAWFDRGLPVQLAGVREGPGRRLGRDQEVVEW